MSHNLSLSVVTERWAIAGTFAISRGAKTEAVVVVATLSGGGFTGRGECVPYARYGESVASVTSAIEALRPQLAAGLTRKALQDAMPPGAAPPGIFSASAFIWSGEGMPPPKPIAWAMPAIGPRLAPPNG